MKKIARLRGVCHPSGEVMLMQGKYVGGNIQHHKYHDSAQIQNQPSSGKFNEIIKIKTRIRP